MFDNGRALQDVLERTGLNAGLGTCQTDCVEQSLLLARAPLEHEVEIVGVRVVDHLRRRVDGELGALAVHLRCEMSGEGRKGQMRQVILSG